MIIEHEFQVNGIDNHLALRDQNTLSSYKLT